MGFTVVIDQLMNTLNRQNIEVEYAVNRTLICFDDTSFEMAARRAAEIRAEGKGAELMRLVEGLSKDQIREYANRVHAQNILIIRNGDLQEC